MIDVRATVRLQFHKGFTFTDAIPLVDYFSRLGISHIYGSPILKARPGSTHGYDVVDPSCINPELGGESELGRLVEELRRHNMGLIVDLVPNHMAVGGQGNPWWLDVLEWGRQSPFAKFFDIHWNSPDPLLKGQCLVPFLGSDYGEALCKGQIELAYNADTGSFYASHFDHLFPICPSTYGEILSASPNSTLRQFGESFAALENSPSAWEEAKTLRREFADWVKRDHLASSIQEELLRFFPNEKQQELDEEQKENLHRLLELQNYRLASWRTAADDINWRRFFDINELAGLRMERHDVFEAVHAKIFDLVAKGWIDGLRIDHVDGLANPRAYCRKLRRRVQRLLPARPESAAISRFPIYVEKILAAGEQLPTTWQVDGTTGYEFMNQVNLLQHHEAGGRQMANYWHQVSGRPADFMEEVLEARRLILATSLAGDFETVAQNLLLIARSDIHTRDITLAAIRRVLTELLVYFPVYRTYAGACARTEQDQVFFQRAFEGARSALQESEWPLLERLAQWLGGEALHELPPGPDRSLRARTIARFQQLTSPTAAKAVEDTATYRSAALLSRNDVGFDPEHTGISFKDFHQNCAWRQQYFPRNLLTTATHDHKRGEDTRARLAVLSERPDWFMEKVRQWRMSTRALRTELNDGPAPSPGDEWILLQTLLGSWPLEDSPDLDVYLQRLRGWQEKALREAKLRSTWNAPNGEYEQACQQYLNRIFEDADLADLRNDIARSAMQIAPAGALNGLAQTLLRLTTPGIPDLFQGTEFWDFSLVDPDNRRPVDFAAREQALFDEANPAELITNWRNGCIKQYLISRVLAARQQYPSLFVDGSYQPLELRGEMASHCVAFLRRLKDSHSNSEQICVALAPRLTGTLLRDSTIPHVPPGLWADTAIVLPEDIYASHFFSVITNNQWQAENGLLNLRELLQDFPVNVALVKSGGNLL